MFRVQIAMQAEDHIEGPGSELISGEFEAVINDPRDWLDIAAALNRKYNADIPDFGYEVMSQVVRIRGADGLGVVMFTLCQRGIEMYGQCLVRILERNALAKAAERMGGAGDGAVDFGG